MILRPALLLSVLLPLAACKPQPEAPVEPATPAVATTPAPAPATAVETAAEPAPAATPDVPVGPAPVVGIDYVAIAGGKPFEASKGRIEVAEAFSYTCPHCDPAFAGFKGLAAGYRD